MILRGEGTSGLTLIELVVAMVVISIGVTAVLGMIGTASRSSANPMLRIKAVELAQSYADEIMSARWDVNDYDGLTESGDDIGDGYNDYEVAIDVGENAGGDLANVDDADAKKVTINVTDPSGTTMTFTFYRLNY